MKKQYIRYGTIFGMVVLMAFAIAFFIYTGNKIKEYNKDVFLLGEAFIENKRLSQFAIGVDSLVNFPVAGKLTDLFNDGYDIISFARQIQQSCKRYNPNFTLTNAISSTAISPSHAIHAKTVFKNKS